MLKLNKAKVLQWSDEALTIKGQSLFLYLKSAYWSFHFAFVIIILPNTGGFNMKIIFENLGGTYT